MTTPASELAKLLADAYLTTADLAPGQDALVLVRMSVIRDVVAHLEAYGERPSGDSDQP